MENSIDEMEEWNEAKRKFYDSDYETASGPSFVTASVTKSVSTEVYSANYNTVYKVVMITHKFFVSRTQWIEVQMLIKAHLKTRLFQSLIFSL